MFCSIEETILELKSGGVVALPTETVYGLAASIFDEAAIRKIFSIKGRPLIDPLIVHVLNFEWVERCADLNSKNFSRAKKIADEFWPGPITIVVPKKRCILDLITAGKNTVAIRCPAHAIFQKILSKIDSPIAAPSANPFGYVSPTKASHVENTLGKRIKVVDGGQCQFGLESTIIDISGDGVRILRPGAITCEEISRCIGEEVSEYVHVVKFQDIDCPGQLKNHYSPKTKLNLIDAHVDYRYFLVNKRNAVILLKRPDVFSKNVFWFSEDGDLLTIAKNVFDVLQKLDEKNYEQIFCQIPPYTGIGEAINDRLNRAAAK